MARGLFQQWPDLWTVSAMARVSIPWSFTNPWTVSAVAREEIGVDVGGRGVDAASG